MAAADPVRVLVWDERQKEQKQVYANFLGNEIANHLRSRQGFTVQSVGLDDPQQGLPDEVLDQAQVLIWWGHVRHTEIKPEKGRQIVERVKAGKLALIALHSAHWSTPFIEAMYERTRIDARRRYPDAATKIEFVPMAGFLAPTYDSLLTPAYYALHAGGVVKNVRVDLPNCVFPSYRHDAKHSRVTMLHPEHPIAQGVPPVFEVSQTEMYDEPFHVPEPDAVIFQETFRDGGWFRGGMVWTLGKGKVFYFRPGHETYPVFKEEYPLRILENAARWLAGGD